MIETEQSQNRRVQIVDMNLVLHGGGSEFVGRSVNGSALHSTAGEPCAEGLVVMIAAGIVVPVPVAHWLAAEFAAPDDQRAIE